MTAVISTFKNDVIQLLEVFGYGYDSTTDNWQLEFCIQKVEHHIKNQCNITDIPTDLLEVAAERVAGEFLFQKLNSGQLEGFDLNLDAIEKQITEGDTSVTFAIGEGSRTPEQRLIALLTHLMNSGESQFIRYRRLLW